MLIFSALSGLVIVQSPTAHREAMDTGDGAQTFTTARLRSHPSRCGVSEGLKNRFYVCFVCMFVCVRARELDDLLLFIMNIFVC